MKKKITLSKEQILYIDDYLKHHKVKYWDIRIELLDHIVSSVEEKIDKGISFDDAMTGVHQNFGNSMKMLWNTGVEYSIFANGDGYKDLIQVKREQINKKYRNLYFKEIKNFFKSFRNVLVLLSFIFIEFLLFKQMEFNWFKKVNLVLFISPILLFYGYSFRNFLMKKRSINMQYALLYVTSSSLILQGFIQFINVEEIFKVSDQTQAMILAVILPLNLALIYCGFEVYKKAENFYLEVFNKLQSL